MSHQVLSNYEIKEQARHSLRGKTFTVVGMLVIIFVISALISQLIGLVTGDASEKITNFVKNQVLFEITPSIILYVVLTLVLKIILIPANLGVTKYTLEINRTNKIEAPYDMLLSHYKNFKHIGTMIAVYVLREIIIILGCFLIIPGLILVFSYALTPYILIEEPTVKAVSVLKKSRQMMKGYKFKLFMLYLSLIGWFILSIITCGLLLLWLVPFVHTLTGKFYDEVLKANSPDTDDTATTNSEQEYDNQAKPEVFTEI